jgi:hypothetical protein
LSGDVPLVRSLKSFVFL